MSSFSVGLTGATRRFAGALVAATLLTAAQVAPDPLLDAIERGDIATVRSLLVNRKDPNVVRPDGLSALHVAAEAGHVEIAKLLVEAGATIDAKTRVGACTPLHLAARSARGDVVDLLLFSRADVGAVTIPDGVTPLHMAAQAPNGERIVRELLRRGAPVDARDSVSGQTPLMLAAANGRAASMRELVSGGADQGASAASSGRVVPTRSICCSDPSCQGP